MDLFEKKIKEERAALDRIEQVDETKLWRNIHGALNDSAQKKSYRFLQWYAAAASLLLLVAFGWLMYQQGVSDGGAAIASQTLNPAINTASRQLPPELLQQEEKYQMAVAKKKESLQLDQISKEDFKDIFTELKVLDEIHQEFRNDLPNLSNDEKIIKVLKKYYERKLRILDHLNKEIEKKSRHEKRNQQKVL
ncbi:MAG: hypothetical protein AB8G15_06175 [Saprospiraceae bacterium]